MQKILQVFFAGILGDFELSESFHVEPAALYGKAENSKMLFIPVLAKNYFGGSCFNLMAGPQGTLILDEINPSYKRLGWDLPFGAGYDVTEGISIRVRYSSEITNRYNEDIMSAFQEVNAKVNNLFAGVGYKFEK